MKLIAIETSERVGSVYAVEQSGDRCAGALSAPLPAGVRSARSLAPALRELLEKSGWAAADLGAVAVSSGPGSFTGLRIGVTTAKMLAFAAGCGVVEVNTLAVIADQARTPGQPGWVVMDAQRGELFAARVDAQGRCGEVELLSCDAWLALLKAGDWAAGPVLAKLQGQLAAGVRPASESDWAPRAETVARLALPEAIAGRLVAPAEVLPRYYRLSAAEEKRLKQPAP